MGVAVLARDDGAWWLPCPPSRQWMRPSKTMAGSRQHGQAHALGAGGVATAGIRRHGQTGPPPACREPPARPGKATAGSCRHRQAGPRAGTGEPPARLGRPVRGVRGATGAARQARGGELSSGGSRESADEGAGRGEDEGAGSFLRWAVGCWRRKYFG